MKKTDWQYMVVTLIFMCIIGMAIIGFLRGLIISKDFTASENVLNLRCHYWGNIHFYLSIAFAVLSIVYIILSWSWIKDKGSQLFYRGWAVMIILITVIFFLVFLLLWAASPKASDDALYEGKIHTSFVTDQMTLTEEKKQTKKEQETKEELKHKERPQQQPEQRLVAGRRAAVPSGILITGEMSLYDLEEITDIPARKIADELGIPLNVSLHEHLGRLRKKYLFSMQEVRNLVASLMKKNINKKTKNGSQKFNES